MRANGGREVDTKTTAVKVLFKNDGSSDRAEERSPKSTDHAIEVVDRLLSIVNGGHSDEAEATGALSLCDACRCQHWRGRSSEWTGLALWS